MNMHGSARNWVLTLAVVAAIALAGYLSFEFGRIQADFNVVDAADERQSYEDTIAQLEQEIETLKQEIELQRTHRNIERAAYKEIETGLGRLENKIQEQRDAIAFYRGIISPADGGKGLRVQNFKVSKGKEDREYNLRLVLVQVKQHDRSVKGNVQVRFEGEQDGVAKTYTLKELAEPGTDTSWPFAFRYFQDFDRQLILPVGFSPERINIEVQSKTKSVAGMKQSFPWQAGNS
jgi:septal ring factor EnvC (AmiA/AmiB activator)